MLAKLCQISFKGAIFGSSLVFGLGKRDFGNKISSLITGIFTRNFDRALLILLEKYLCYSRSYEFQDCWSPQGSATIGSFFVFLL